MIKGFNIKDKKNLFIFGFSFLSVIIIFFVSYILGNSPYSTFDNLEHYTQLEYFNHLLRNDSIIKSDVLYIDISHDRKLIPHYDEMYQLPDGNIDITDREKLAKFLQILRKSDDYKYIFLDVRFEKGYNDNDTINAGNKITTVDQYFLSTILNTPRICVSTHSDMEQMDSSLNRISGINDFKTVLGFGDFARYRLSYDGKQSVALKMYSDITGYSYKKHGPFYFSNGSLCSNAPFLRIPSTFPAKYANDGKQNYYDLGADILDLDDDAAIADMVKNKYVIVSDLQEDRYDTYVGKVPGSYITFNVLRNMLNGAHLINWWAVWFLSIIYFIMCLLICYDINLLNYIPYINQVKSKIGLFFLDLIKFALVLDIFASIVYVACGETFCFWFPLLYFTLLKQILYFKRS